MASAEPQGLVWEQVGSLPDCAFACIGDPAMLDDDGWLKADSLPLLQLGPGGFGMLYDKAETDGLPIELGRLSGEVVAARMEFTNDVAQLECSGEGEWSELGMLKVGDGGAVAADAGHHDLVGYRHRLPLPGGWYRADTFIWGEDHLGIRLMKQRPSS